jgi:Xaa-Pro aminopeptidase
MLRVIAFLLAAAPITAQTGIPASEFPQRRAELRKSLDGILVLFGAREETRDGFFQEPNFLYLTGWTRPGAVLLLTPKEEILLLPPKNPRRELYDGRLGAPDDPDIRSFTGFDQVAPLHALTPRLLSLLEAYGKVYFLGRPPQSEELRRLLSFHEVGDARLMLARLRMKKSPAEIALLERATEATLAAHRAAWNRIAPGLYEYEVAAIMSYEYRMRGCERHAYPPIVGSGPNSVILHYNQNRRRMDSGDLLVMDVGAECSGYAADITRTVPVNGKFTPRQREIYEIVLGAQEAAIAAVKPGIKYSELNEIAKKFVNSRGKDRKGEPLGKYYLHGLGHHIGLEVHDATDPDLTLAPGMVFTIEPGLYLAEEGIGVRIEDMILVTEKGARILSDSLPRDPDAIEKAFASRRP